MVLTWIFVAVALLGLRRWAFPSPEWRRARGERFARRNRAYVDAAFVERFDLVATWSSRLTIVLVGLGPTAVLLYRNTTVGNTLLAVVLVDLVVLAGFRLWIAGSEFPPLPGAPSIARSRHLTMTDYVRPAMLVLGAACVAVAAVVLTVALVMVSGPDGQDPAVAAAVMASSITIVLGLVAPLYLWVMTRRPQPAMDEAHLYFQDAWRASLLNGAVITVGYGGWTSFALLSRPGSALPAALLGTVLLVLWSMDATTLRFRRRLWPELAPDEVLVPDMMRATRGGPW